MPTDTPHLDRYARQAAWYAAAAAGVLGISSAADAQIVYTDLEPDGIAEDTEDINVSLGLGPHVDFDNDGDAEIVFGEDIGRPYIVFANDDTLPDSLSGVIGTLVPFGTGLYMYPIPMNAGAMVQEGPDLITGYSLGTFTFQGSDPNLWIGSGDAYLGVRFGLDDGTHFGWVRCEVPVSGRLVIKDYAYEAAVNTPIAAGDIGTAVEPGSLPAGYLFSEVAPHPVVAQSAFAVAVATSERVRVDIVDVRGRVVRTVFDDILPGGQRRDLHFAADGLASGVYVLRVTGESFVSTRRVAVVR